MRTAYIALMTGLLLAPIGSYAARKHKGCNHLYFGLGQAPDLSAAFKCYEKNEFANDKLYLSLMYFNGEGTQRDFKKALQLVNEMQEKERSLPGHFTSMQSEKLKKKIEAALSAPNPDKVGTLDFCKDVAADHVTLDECITIKRERWRSQGK
jgi:hypothetical protein